MFKRVFLFLLAIHCAFGIQVFVHKNLLTEGLTSNSEVLNRLLNEEMHTVQPDASLDLDF